MNPRTKSQDIRDLSQNDIRELVAELGQPAFRAKQLIEWVFEKNVCSFDDMTNLPKAFREQLKDAFAFDRGHYMRSAQICQWWISTTFAVSSVDFMMPPCYNPLSR